MAKLWFFPQAETTVEWRNDGGLVAPLTPDTHPTGRAGVSWEPPADYPNGNGGNLIQSRQGATDDLRGRLIRFDDAGEWVLAVDEHVIADSFKVAARDYKGNMCGVRVPGVRALTGAADPTTILSWAYDHYNDDERRLIRDDWRRKGLVDVLLSWPDSRGMGLTPQQFGQTVRDLRRQGFVPCVMLLSKDFDRGAAVMSTHSRSGEVVLSRTRDWRDPNRPKPEPLSTGDGGRLALDELPRLQAELSAVLPYLTKNAPRLCVAWEASLWLMPDLHQALTDWLAPQITPWGGRLYVHFQQGYASWQGYGPEGEELPFGAYWDRNVGKLTGVLYQKILDDDDATFQSRLRDVLERFAGKFPCPTDSGFGHPFDLVALELNAERQYQGRDSEAEGDRLGRVAMATPAVESVAGFGLVKVMGSGNGCV